MTLKKFKKILMKIIEDTGDFITDDCTNKFFEDIDDNMVVVSGEDEEEVFYIKIEKVKM